MEVGIVVLFDFRDLVVIKRSRNSDRKNVDDRGDPVPYDILVVWLVGVVGLDGS